MKPLSIFNIIMFAIVATLLGAETNHTTFFLNNRNSIERARTLSKLEQAANQEFKKVVASQREKQYELFFKNRLAMLAELYTLESRDRTIALKKRAMHSGAISGVVRVAGSFHFEAVDVLAFDTLGYCLGAGRANSDNGYYCIENLPNGSYYVVTKSCYIDEFYNNIRCRHYENWRLAEWVSVSENTITQNIDFDLDRGAIITGKVMDNATDSPVSNRFMRFYWFSQGNLALLDSCITFLDVNGRYTITYDQPGSYFLKGVVTEYAEQFFSEKSSIESANPIEIVALNQEVANVDFRLIKSSMSMTGSIAGMVYESESNRPLELVEVIAFNLNDTHIIFSTFSMFSSNSPNAPPAGSFRMDDLPSGRYVVLANDFWGGHAKEYFKEAEFENDATPVTVENGKLIDNIDFTLSVAGEITGKVRDERGISLDSLLVLAIPHEEFKSPECLMDRFINGNLHFDLTDDHGQYRIKGLPKGKYIVHSYSYLTRPGMYLDQKYPKLINLSNIKIEDIDFILEPAGAITGRLSDTNLNPIQGGVNTYVFDAVTSNYEFFTHFELDGTYYRISGLNTGQYKVFFDISTASAPYTSQFYENHAKFALSGAKPITVLKGMTTENIIVTISLGGSLQGYVFLPDGRATGADTLKETLMILYDVSDAAFVMDKTTTFCGGYFMSGIPPGSYKLCAFPTLSYGAVAYHGGGGTYNDLKSKVIDIKLNDILQADITLSNADARIEGLVVKDSNLSPLNFVYIMAYDETGHAVSFGVSGVNLRADRYIGDGKYSIPSLRTGSYFLRSWLIFSLYPFFTKNLDPHYNRECFDEWYREIRIEPHFVNDSFSFYGSYFVPPFSTVIHPGATKIIISDPNDIIRDVNFELDPVESLQSSKSRERIANQFMLYQSVPNPFNSSTIIQYSIEKDSHVTLSIYNIKGERVIDLIDSFALAGLHSITWSGQNMRDEKVSSGVYFCVLKNQYHVQVKKMTFLN